ncbi:MAG: hypothetical protein E7653_03865 [Ruminococcaceae bacterium]|nr:hypothetical protein [Oscillospiraceae bacterium]
MGRSFDTHEELDRPDLNKCPDCGCFFVQECCPLCGKVCPEEMRAGNRKPVKKVKQKSGGSDRVMFVQWYHSWWFIIAMLVLFPIAGLVLFATSPHKKSAKIIFAVVLATLFILAIYGPLLIFWAADALAPDPVDTSLSREEYVEKSEAVDAEQLYRNPSSYEGKIVTLTLKIKQKTVDYYSDEYTNYYVCEDESGRFEFIILDCSQDGTKNFLIGDTITIFGEVTEQYELYINDQTVSAPSINAAYITVE